MEKLVYLTTPTVTIATNTFINVPRILVFENTDLISIVGDHTFGFTTEIPIYHNDGTYLAKAKGSRIFATDDGKKAGIEIDEKSDLWVCRMGKQIIFEIKQRKGDAFRIDAELYAPEGYFLKVSELNPKPNFIMMLNGDSIEIDGSKISGCTKKNFPFGIWIHKDGSITF